MVMLSLEMIAEIRRIAELYATTERARLARAEEAARAGYARAREITTAMLARSPEGIPLAHLVDAIPEHPALSEVRIARMALEGLVATSTLIDGLHDPLACIVTPGSTTTGPAKAHDGEPR